MRKLLLLFIFATVSLAALSDGVPALQVSASSKQNNVELSGILSIKYSDTHMIVTMKDGSQQTFPLDDIQVMHFGQMAATAIASLLSEAGDNGTYTITDLQGKVVLAGRATSARQVILPQKRGIYTLTVNGRSKKILLK